MITTMKLDLEYDSFSELHEQVESLRKDIEILSQNHERDVDRKDAIIQMLDRDLEEVRNMKAVTINTRCFLRVRERK